MLQRLLEPKLHALIAVMDQALGWLTGGNCLIQRIQDQRGVGRTSDLPADNATSEDIDHKSRINKALPGWA